MVPAFFLRGALFADELKTQPEARLVFSTIAQADIRGLATTRLLCVTEESLRSRHERDGARPLLKNALEDSPPAS